MIDGTAVGITPRSMDLLEQVFNKPRCVEDQDFFPIAILSFSIVSA